MVIRLRDPLAVLPGEMGKWVGPCLGSSRLVDQNIFFPLSNGQWSELFLCVCFLGETLGHFTLLCFLFRGQFPGNWEQVPLTKLGTAVMRHAMGVGLRNVGHGVSGCR